jgi:7-carboxy-7-deazaguanine synthase
MNNTLETNKDLLSKTLNINEMFFSIQGEGTRSGLPCIFIRLHGCKLRCSYCDTPYALNKNVGGNVMTLQSVLEYIQSKPCSFVEFTGGEPLEQENVFDFFTYLIDIGKTVAIETAGHISLEKVDPRVVKILDVKCPSSNMTKFNVYDNFQYIDSKDEVKFVIGTDEDFLFALQICKQYDLTNKTTVLFSPVFSKMPYQTLAEKILETGKNIRFQIQLHKYIWDPSTRGV